MAIRQPEIRLSRSDKRLLVLLSNLLVNEGGGNVRSAVDPAKIVLSDQEADELIRLLNLLLENKRFRESVFMAEALTHPDESETQRAKGIYLKQRAATGRTRVMSGRHWLEFLRRLGTTTRGYPDQTTEAMSFDHFVSMERKLLRALAIDPRVQEILERTLHMHQEQIESARSGNAPIPVGRSMEQIEAFRNAAEREQRVLRLYATCTIMLVADTGAMFTTRDWSVATSISAMASAIAAPIVEDVMS